MFKSEYMRDGKWLPGSTLGNFALGIVRKSAFRMGAEAFRIVRLSDGIVVAESKRETISTPEPTPPAPQADSDDSGPASEPVAAIPVSSDAISNTAIPVADTRAAIKARLLEKYGDNEYEEELKALRGKAIDFSDDTPPSPVVDESLLDIATELREMRAEIADTEIPFAEGMDDSEPACDWCKSTENVSMRYYRGHAVMQVCEDCMPSQDTVDPQPATALTDDLLAESRAGWGERTELLAEWAERDSMDEPISAPVPLADEWYSNNDTMPSIPAYIDDSVVSETTQLSSTVKAPKAPVMTKKERRRQKQAAIRQQYANRERKVIQLPAHTPSRRRNMAMFSQMAALGMLNYFFGQEERAA